MLDWRILAASFVAFALLSLIFVGGLGEIFSDISSGFSNWIGSDTLTGLFTKPQSSQTPITISIYHQSLGFRPLSAVNISSEDFSAENFNGQINISFPKSSIELQSSQNQLRITIPLSKPLQITHLYISDLKVSDAAFDIERQIKADSGNLAMKGFAGTAAIDGTGITFQGNITSVQAVVNGKKWELK
ncbi:MAG: hypothetical protein HYX24_02890 [Candidatus Aenigmarchaeota archaeon]|nr:hypothetical protein [Candidatus Aenigmarchaeota archaeon]